LFSNFDGEFVFEPSSFSEEPSAVSIGFVEPPSSPGVSFVVGWDEVPLEENGGKVVSRESAIFQMRRV
jgi:hypothetical protein